MTIENVGLPFDVGRQLPKPRAYVSDLGRLGVFSSVAADASGAMNLGGAGEAIRVSVAYVTAGFFRTMGRTPILGRSFTRAEGTNGGDWHVAILSHRLWMQEFGGSQDILGRSFSLNAHEFRIVGVMPASFTFPSAPDLWLPFPLPISSSQVFEAFGMYIPTNTVGRLRPGVSVRSADIAVARMERDYPTWSYMADSARVLVKPLQGSLLTMNARHALVALGLAAGLVFALASINLAWLVSARRIRQEREVAVRIALGASLMDIVRLFVLEELLLSAAGAAGGVLIAQSTIRILDALLPPTLLAITRPSLDVRVLLLAIGVTVLVVGFVGIGFGTQIGGARIGSSETTGESKSFHRASAVRELLSAFQIALALVLVVAAGLMVRRFHSLATERTGMDLRDAGVGQVSLPHAVYASGSAVTGFVEGTVRALVGNPGVQSAAAVNVLPMASHGSFGEALTSPNSPADTLMALVYAVTPGYFASLGIPLVTGRDFSWSDEPYHALIVNVAIAKRLWPNKSPIGREVLVDGKLRPIIGVVGNVRTRRLYDEAQPQVYVPFSEAPSSSVNIVLRAALPLSAVASRIRGAVRSLDSQQPVYGVQWMENLVATTIADQRSASVLLSAFSGIALALAAIGVYGLTAHRIAGRRREFAIRIAVGANPSDLLMRILLRTFALGICGIGAGVVMVIGAARVLSGLIYGLPPISLGELGGAVAVLFVAVMLAGVIPASREVSANPMDAFRTE